MTAENESDREKYARLAAAGRWSTVETIMKRDQFPTTAIRGLNNELKRLLDGMLVFDPDQRLSLEEVWEHPWVQNGKKLFEKSPEGQALARKRVEREHQRSALGALKPQTQSTATLELIGDFHQQSDSQF